MTRGNNRGCISLESIKSDIEKYLKIALYQSQGKFILSPQEQHQGISEGLSTDFDIYGYRSGGTNQFRCCLTPAYQAVDCSSMPSYWNHELFPSKDIKPYHHNSRIHTVIKFDRGKDSKKEMKSII